MKEQEKAMKRAAERRLLLAIAKYLLDTCQGPVDTLDLENAIALIERQNLGDFNG